MPDSSPDQSKQLLRTAALARRGALSVEQRAAAAQAVAARGLPVAVHRGAVVSGYWPIRNEVDPIPLMRRLEAAGAQLALPVIVGREAPLAFRAWTAETQLLRGQLGIMEPSPLAAVVIPDILLVPLAAFDRAGHRIGYGAGHYDRSFAQLRAAKAVVAIGLAYALQEIPEVPASAHDAALDYVLTEGKTFDFRSS
jgi:5-formyltetrahydrofolate cyclo-ligase